MSDYVFTDSHEPTLGVSESYLAADTSVTLDQASIASALGEDLVESFSESYGCGRGVRWFYDEWLHRPHPAFDDKTPHQVIVDGKFNLIKDCLEANMRGLKKK